MFLQRQPCQTGFWKNEKINTMKTLNLEKMENLEGGGCALAGEVVGAFWASGIGYAFGPYGLVAGFAASLIVIGVCRIV
jgi:hypothetical protein